MSTTLACPHTSILIVPRISVGGDVPDLTLDRYRLVLNTSPVIDRFTGTTYPISLCLYHAPVHSFVDDPEAGTAVFEDLPPSNMRWRKDGLVFWNAGDEGESVSDPTGELLAELCRVSGYRWVKSDVDHATKVASQTGDQKGTDEDKENVAAGTQGSGEGEAMEVDK